MATSPLTAALMGSQNADPTAMMLNPQMQLAQGLLQQGTDASPIRSPWQGLARLAQVMAGRHIENKAMQGASSMYGKAAEDAAKTVPEGSAIYKALTSDNPLIKMQALNVFNKSILQFSEPKDLSPGSQSIVPGVAAPVGQNTNPMTPEGQRAADAAANPNMAAGNANVLGAATKAETDAHNQSDLNYKPAIAGQTAVAENPALIARAGGVAGAEAPWKTEQTRSGAIIPLTSIPGIGQRVPGQGAMPPLPPAKPPVLQPQMPPPGGAAPPAQAAAPGAPNQFGGGVRPLPGGAGIMAPSQEVFESLIKQDRDEVSEDRERATNGMQDQATVTMIKDLMPRVKTGWSAQTKSEAGSILQSMGVDPKEIANFTSIDPSSSQVLQKKFVELSAAAARSMGAREPGSVISMFAKAYPNLATQPDAVNVQANALYMNSLWRQKLATDKTNYVNDSVNSLQREGEYRGLKGFNEAFAKTDNANDYLRAAEAMSGEKWSPWGKMKSVADQRRIISLIPQGTEFFHPDGTMHVRN